MTAKIRQSLFGNLLRLLPGGRRNSKPWSAHESGNGAARPHFRVKGPGAPTPHEIDTRFTGLLLGVNSLVDLDLNPFELEVLERFERILASRQLDESLLPRQPELLPRLLSLLRSGDYSATSLAKEIARDGALVAEVLRLANSAWYRGARPIESLEQAIVQIGEEGMRQVITTAAFRPLFQCRRDHGHFSCIGMDALWQQTVLVSRAADCIAESENAERFPAFLAGILSTTGPTILIRELDASFTGRHAPRSLLFSEHLLQAGRRLSEKLASQWKMPDEVLAALDDQVRTRELPGMSRLGQILFVAEKMARLHALQQSGRYAGRYDEIGCLIDRGIADSCSHCFRRLSEVGGGP